MPASPLLHWKTAKPIQQNMQFSYCNQTKHCLPFPLNYQSLHNPPERATRNGVQLCFPSVFWRMWKQQTPKWAFMLQLVCWRMKSPRPSHRCWSHPQNWKSISAGHCQPPFQSPLSDSHSLASEMSRTRQGRYLEKEGGGGIRDSHHPSPSKPIQQAAWMKLAFHSPW